MKQPPRTVKQDHPSASASPTTTETNATATANLRKHAANAAVTFTLEIDHRGDGTWTEYTTVNVGAGGYAYHVFPYGFEAAWIRVRASAACRATAYFHYASSRSERPGEGSIFASLPKAGDSSPWCAGLIKPSAHNTNLRFIPTVVDAVGMPADAGHFEVDKTMAFTASDDEAKKTASLKLGTVKQDFTVDDASVIMTAKGLAGRPLRRRNQRTASSLLASQVR